MALKNDEKSKRPKDMQHLINIFNTFQEFHLITAGIELGLFDFLEGKKLTSEQIAQSMGFEKELIEAWCEAAAACGYLQLEGKQFSLTRWAKSFLVSKSPLYVGYFTKYTTIIPDAYSELEARFKGKRPLMETQHALKTVESIAPIARLVVPVLIQNVPILREKCHILDLGTGLGSYLINFALNNPAMTGVGVDGGWVAAIVYEARKNVEQYHLQNRIKIILADVMDLQTPEKFDVIFMSGFLQAFNPENALAILKNAWGWLKPKGILILQEMLLEEGRLKPKSNALLNLLLHLETPQAGLFEYDQLKAMLLEAQFPEIKRIDILPEITHIVAQK